MKSNLRNEIKSYIVRQGLTMQEVVDLLHDEHGWSDSVSNLSNKLQRESLRYVEAVTCRCTGLRDYLEETKVRRDFYDRCRKEVVAGTAPIGGSAGAGSCQGAQSQNAQAHSGGCNSGKDAARGTDDGTVCTGGLPDTEAAAARLNSAGRSPGNRGPSSFFSRRAHLLTTLKGSGISCGNRALCEANAAAAAASRQCHNTCGCCCHRLRRRQFPAMNAVKQG